MHSLDPLSTSRISYFMTKNHFHIGGSPTDVENQGVNQV